MYAIIETSGRQYRVEKGDIFDIDLLEKPSEDQIHFEKVLLFHDGKKVYLGDEAKCTVTGKFLSEVKGKKLINFKYRRRKKSRRMKGHRQRYSRIEITDIKGD